MVGAILGNVTNKSMQLTRYARHQRSFLIPKTPSCQHDNPLHDENIFHIRSFHASRRREPNSIDVLCAYYFLGCLIIFNMPFISLSLMLRVEIKANIILFEDLGPDFIEVHPDGSIAYIAAG